MTFPLLGSPRPVPVPHGRAGDPHWSSVSLLARLDSPHGSRSFVDSSPSPKSLTANANAVASGQVTLFGANTASLDGSSDSITSPTNPGFSFGTGDFTVEMFVWFASLPAGQQAFVNVPVSGGFSLYWTGPDFFGSGTNRLIVSNRQSNQLNAAWSPTTRAWHHIAVARASGQLRAFINGVAISTVTATTNYAQSTLQVGGSSDGAAWTINGHIGNVRITRGVARYVGNFAPVTGPFPVGPQ